MYRPGSVTPPAFCQEILLTTDQPQLQRRPAMIGRRHALRKLKTGRQSTGILRTAGVVCSVVAGAAGCLVTGSCSTVTRWPSTSWVTST